MADFFFFTDSEKLKQQDSSKAFGVIDRNNYRISSMHSANSLTKAYAITSGQVLVQNIQGEEDLVTIVLKPNVQPDLNLPKVEYIIYKGILKSSLVTGTKVAPNTNDLTRQIYTDLELYYKNLVEEPIPEEMPHIGNTLGLNYQAETTEVSYLAKDSDPLSKAFYNSNADQMPLQSVRAGFHIGDFTTENFGILISFEKIGFTPTFKLARELESKISFDEDLSDAARSAEKFKRKHDKEEVHNFIDPAAFFGAFTQLGLESKGEKKEDALYDAVISKFANRNTIYLDIRNEYDDSFNYYENYGDTIFWNTSSDTEELESVNYYEDTQWPILAIEESKLSSKTLKLALPKGDNDYPLLFLKRGYLENLGVDKLPEKYEAYLGGQIDEFGTVSFEGKLQIPTTSSDKIYSNYFQLKYIKRYTTSDSQYAGLSLRKESYLDNLFPVFDMQIPFTNEGSINLKTFTESAYIDKSNINEADFFVNTGVAVDNEAINFIAFPQHYSSSETQTNETLPLSGKQSFDGTTFLDDFNKNFSNYGIQKQNFATKDTNIEYLTLNTGVGQAVIADNGEVSVVQKISIKKASIGKSYDNDNINILSLTKEEMEQLVVLKETQFTEPYKVYLGIGNVNDLSVDKNGYSSIDLVLRGLKEEEGTITTKEVSTTVQMFAEDSIYNWDENSVESG